MSFGKSGNLLTWIIIGLVGAAVGAGAGIGIGYAVFQGGAVQTVTLEIKGSTTVEPICLATAPDFEAAHPGVEIAISAAGSGTGITAVMDGQADIAMSSRAVKSSENATAHTNTGEYLRAFALAKDALAVVTHSDATTNFDMNITLVRMIFNGSITSWDHPELTGNGLTGDIQVIARESTSGTRGSFDDMVMDDDDYVADFQEKISNQEVHDTVASNPQAIGYIGLAYMSTSVDSVLIEGVEATKANVIADTYQLSRSLYLVTLGTPAFDSLIWEYVQWHFSPSAQYHVDDVGYIAVGQTRDDLT
jgi:phosphate transport system substrate-binding protein